MVVAEVKRPRVRTTPGLDQEPEAQAMVIFSTYTVPHDEAHRQLCARTIHQVRLSDFGTVNGTRFCGSDGITGSNVSCAFTVLSLQDVSDPFVALAQARAIQIALVLSLPSIGGLPC